MLSHFNFWISWPLIGADGAAGMEVELKESWLLIKKKLKMFFIILFYSAYIAHLRLFHDNVSNNWSYSELLSEPLGSELSFCFLSPLASDVLSGINTRALRRHNIAKCKLQAGIAAECPLELVLWQKNIFQFSYL